MERVCLPPSSFQNIYFALKFCMRFNRGRFTYYHSSSYICFFNTSQKDSNIVWLLRSKIFLNISTPVTVDLSFSFYSNNINFITSICNTCLNSSGCDRSSTGYRKTSSTGIRKSLSTSLWGNSIHLSTSSINLRIVSTHFCSPLSAPSADPRITGVLSPS